MASLNQLLIKENMGRVLVCTASGPNAQHFTVGQLYPINEGALSITSNLGVIRTRSQSAEFELHEEPEVEVAPPVEFFWNGSFMSCCGTLVMGVCQGNRQEFLDVGAMPFSFDPELDPTMSTTFTGRLNRVLYNLGFENETDIRLVVVTCSDYFDNRQDRVQIGPIRFVGVETTQIDSFENLQQNFTIRGLNDESAENSVLVAESKSEIEYEGATYIGARGISSLFKHPLKKFRVKAGGLISGPVDIGRNELSGTSTTPDIGDRLASRVIPLDYPNLFMILTDHQGASLKTAINKYGCKVEGWWRNENTLRTCFLVVKRQD